MWDLPPLALAVTEAIPAHIGLGSKTSLLMAVGKGICTLARQDISNAELASLVGRGSTSGIGVNTFSVGGVVWDAGHAFPKEKSAFAPSSTSQAPPPMIIARKAAPRFSVVHLRFDNKGLHSTEEADCFRRACPVPETDTLHLLALAATKIMPGFISNDELLVHSGLRRMQELGFKKVEWEHQGTKTKRFRSYWLKSGLPHALCLSSFGPTMFIVTQRPDVVVATVARYDERPLHCTVTTIPNRGAMTRVIS